MALTHFSGGHSRHLFACLFDVNTSCLQRLPYPAGQGEREHAAAPLFGLRPAEAPHALPSACPPGGPEAHRAPLSRKAHTLTYPAHTHNGRRSSGGGSSISDQTNTRGSIKLERRTKESPGSHQPPNATQQQRTACSSRPLGDASESATHPRSTYRRGESGGRGAVRGGGSDWWWWWWQHVLPDASGRVVRGRTSASELSGWTRDERGRVDKRCCSA